MGSGDDPRIEMAFLAGVAWAMGKTGDLMRVNHEYVAARMKYLGDRT